MIDYRNIQTKDLLDVILQGCEQSDEVMYFVLKERIHGKLKEKYEIHERALFEDFEDIINDFFLYLREGRNNSAQAYQALRTIRKKEAFESWLIGTFRNYLTNRSNMEEQNYTLKGQHIAEETNGITDREQLICNAAQLIAYTHQMLFPRSQFIFLRTLLTLLDKSKALPDKEMAKAMGMSHTLYRVTNHRIMQSVKQYQKLIESGGYIQLDDYHKTMAEHINNDFDSLYSTLIRYYNITLQSQEQVLYITSLRNKYYQETGFMLHEDIAPYGSLSIYGFYYKLNSCINQQFAS